MKVVLFGGSCHRTQVELEPGDGLKISMEAKSNLFDPKTGEFGLLKDEYTPRSFDGGDHAIVIWGHTGLTDEQVLNFWLISRGQK